jgi:putative N-acetylmannosamine-6-phosphate epimerase/predicted NBD/HSP70 family sugar kinase
MSASSNPIQQRTQNFLHQVAGGLIVSCQALPDEPLHGAEIMARIAVAARTAGARAIRANSPADISAIRTAINLPIIGLFKATIPGCDVYITPTLDHAIAVAQAGADVIAIDATDRLRPHADSLNDYIAAIHAATGLPVLADVSNFEEGLAAVAAGAELISTTMSGYTPYSLQQAGPDLDLVQRLAAASSAPIIAEGRYHTPDQAAAAIDLGAAAVVVGGAITRPQEIARRFVAALEARPQSGEIRLAQRETKKAKIRPALAFDIGGIKTACAVVAKEGVVHCRREIPTQAATGPDAILQRMISLGRSVLAEYENSANGLSPALAGVASAGQVDMESGEIIFANDNLPGWTGLALGRRLADGLGMPVRVDNDVNCFALAEGTLGAGRTLRSFLMAAVGAGIGGALMIDGRLHRGRHGGAGEIGHLIVAPEHGRPCTAPVSGCWEAYASTSAVLAHSGYSSIQALAAEYASGVTIPAVDEGAIWLGRGLASLVHVLAPEAIILGGSITLLGERFLERVRAGMGANCLPSHQETPIVIAQFGADSGLIGAALLTLQD